ncbi:MULTISPECIES: potassium channel family protein [unclassified Desulfurobacterium]|uniref:potassium channel family protein n=1 Tax=Desulfurobacterium sp. TC5-1 TaxID=1158318 RepID=UPI0003B42EF8|nr:potassium channel protein [Desulfurobacterium sp. TC5-1]
MKKIEKRMPSEFGEDRILEIVMKFRPPLIIALITIMVSTIGYMLISHVRLLKAFYMTILTVTTIGYGEMWNMTAKGRIFNILVMTFGVGSVMGYSIAVLINIVTSGEVKKIVRFRKMVSDINNLKNHYLIFGLNDYVVHLTREFNGKGIPYVVISNSENIEDFAKKNDIKFYLNLDPSNENTIYLANIERAVGAIVAETEDYKNLAITLTVKNVAKKLKIRNFFIFSIINNENFKEKLKLVGADYVETIPEITSRRIASLAEKPPIFGERSFLEELLFGEETFIDIEELLITPESPVCGKTLRELNLKKQFGVTVIAIKKEDGSVVYLPDEATVLEPGDILAVVAPKKNLKKAVKIFVKSGVLSRGVLLKKKLKEREDGLE